MTWHMCQTYSPLISCKIQKYNPELHKTWFFQDLSEIPELHQWDTRDTYQHKEQQLCIIMLRIPTESPKDLQTFINMVNYLGKFIPHLGDQWDKQINSASHTMKIPKLHGYGQVPSRDLFSRLNQPLCQMTGWHYMIQISQLFTTSASLKGFYHTGSSGAEELVKA